MFDKEAKNFDAVMVGTPDHSHYPATVLALLHGKHVFTQKPLTHTVWESRQLAKAMAKYKVATQMGNHGHANEGNRIIVEYVQGGFLGDIKEVHCFTNRPIWPQGIDRPAGEDPIPDGLDWEAWIGPAPMRPYKHDVYAPFKWRGWWDFGAGALGDMACHTMDSLFMSLDPGYPTAVECLSIQGAKPETFPEGSTLKWTFGAKGDRPGFDVFWYDGKNRPERPEGLEDGREIPASGNLYVGTKATLLVTGDYGDSSRIIPEAAHKEMAEQFVKDTGKPRPPQILERSPGHHDEWRMACAGLKPHDFPGSNFSYAGPFTETILLGNVCLKFPSQRLEWDGPNLRFTNNNEANDLVSKTYRDGWDFKLDV
jgi:predicted dehydrogenase